MKSTDACGHGTGSELQVGVTGLVGRAVRLSSEQGEGGAAAVAYKQGKEAKRSERSLHGGSKPRAFLLASATGSTVQKAKRELLPVACCPADTDGRRCRENSYSYQCHVSRNGENKSALLQLQCQACPCHCP